jgi:ectoine hydroxylase-related dioxygenase (phytanoyl-CoA dioxygenase family)
MLENIKKQIVEKGYYVMHDILSEAECEHYKSLLKNDYKKYSPLYAVSGEVTAHGLDNKSTEEIVFNLHNKGMDWYRLFEHQAVIPVLEAMLKDGSYQNSEPYVLLNNSARNPLKGNKGQQLHLDSNLPGGNYPLSIIVIYMLDDFTKESGATRVVPGSHKFGTYAENAKKYDEEITIEASKGSVLIYDASLWHGGGEKLSDNSRWSVILTFGRWFLKPSFDFMKNMPEDIFRQLSEKQKELLGYKCTPPKDEFTRMRRKSKDAEVPQEYKLPG